MMRHFNNVFFYLFLIVPCLAMNRTETTRSQEVNHTTYLPQATVSPKKIWVINKSSAKYEHVYSPDSVHIRTDVNVEFIDSTNKIRIITNDLDTTFLDMSTRYATSRTVTYPDDNAAKFSMICAELGGSILIDYDKAHTEALIISASMENRLYVDSVHTNKGKTEVFCKSYMKSRYGDGSFQSLYTPKQYCAMVCKSYKQFGYGHSVRTRQTYKKLIGLCAVWNSMQNPVQKLTDMGMVEANMILSYCHGGYISLHRGRTLDFSMLNTDNMKMIITSSYYGMCLNTVLAHA